MLVPELEANRVGVRANLHSQLVQNREHNRRQRYIRLVDVTSRMEAHNMTVDQEFPTWASGVRH